MRDYLDKRCLEEAEYIIKTGATVRKTAKEFGLSKSTVHKDVTERLYSIDKSLYKRVKKVLQKNLKERHVRGGEENRKKYLNMIKCKNKK